MRVAMIGCGAVGAIHAACLQGSLDAELVAVYTPQPEHAAAFARQFCVGSVALSLEEAIAEADVAIISSPTALHFDQARECLLAGRHVLIELPPCDGPAQADELGTIAQRQGVVLGCTHTSRYLAPYARIHSALQSGLIGEIQGIGYIRCLQLRPRTWTDNALLHHGAHIIDLAMLWCGDLKPIACAAYPEASSARSVCILASFAGGKPLTASISYGARLTVSKLVMVGSKHTVETDGFSFLHSDLAELEFAGDERTVYEQAIATQDTQFFGACRGENTYIPWTETENLIHMIHQFQRLSGASK